MPARTRLGGGGVRSKPAAFFRKKIGMLSLTFLKTCPNQVK
ncbi:hypothetical protein [Helicobacter suis]|nr:hypothetical protein [Helicobacter suis]